MFNCLKASCVKATEMFKQRGKKGYLLLSQFTILRRYHANVPLGFLFVARVLWWQIRQRDCLQRSCGKKSRTVRQDISRVFQELALHEGGTVWGELYK